MDLSPPISGSRGTQYNNEGDEEMKEEPEKNQRIVETLIQCMSVESPKKTKDDNEEGVSPSPSMPSFIPFQSRPPLWAPYSAGCSSLQL